MLTVACSWASLLKPYIQQAMLSYYRVQNMNPRPSPSPKHGKMPIRVTALVFDLCVLVDGVIETAMQRCVHGQWTPLTPWSEAPEVANATPNQTSDISGRRGRTRPSMVSLKRPCKDASIDTHHTLLRGPWGRRHYFKPDQRHGHRWCHETAMQRRVHRHPSHPSKGLG